MSGWFAEHPECINRNGRPKKGETYTDIIRQMGDLPNKELTSDDKKDLKTAIIEKLYNLALSGDVSALRYLIDRVDGKPKETIDLNDTRKDKLVEVLEKLNESK